MTKITLKIVKFGVQCYVPNGKINLRSNFNSKKLVKCETLLYDFVEVGIKGGEIFWNVSKFHVHACLSNGHSNLWLGLKVVKIAWNVAKVGVHACLSNGHPNL